eukprot:jgi/Mesen1/5981/ME000302S04983
MDRGGGQPSTSLAEATSPLLGSGERNSISRTLSSDGNRSGRLSGDASRYLRRAGSSRFMREQSMVVRETAREQLEERQSDWAYSRPVVVLDLIWNLAFVTVAAVVLALSRYENPPAPLRLWVVGYALQCIVHMICVWSEYGRRRRRGSGSQQGSRSSSRREQESGSRRRNEPDVEAGDVSSSESRLSADEEEEEEGISLAKRLESANTMFSFVWWMVGFWWILSGIENGFPEAPLLSWLCTVFLAFDVFFVVFCVALACVIGVAVCCCLPCIIAILYAVADQDGASDDDIRALPKYKFKRLPVKHGESEKVDKVGGVMSLLGSAPSPDRPAERQILAEDAECCICLTTYEDEAELRELQCTHHFHCACIDKWLRTKPTCPLCKYDIINGNGANQNSPSVSSEGETNTPSAAT